MAQPPWRRVIGLVKGDDVEAHHALVFQSDMEGLLIALGMAGRGLASGPEHVASSVQQTTRHGRTVRTGPK